MPSDMKIGHQMWMFCSRNKISIRVWLMTTRLGLIRDKLLAHMSHGLKEGELL